MQGELASYCPTQFLGDSDDGVARLGRELFIETVAYQIRSGGGWFKARERRSQGERRKKKGKKRRKERKREKKRGEKKEIGRAHV